MNVFRSPRGLAPVLRPPLLTGVVYTALSVATTWPLTRSLSVQLYGDALDPWQTLWGFWWFASSARFGHAFTFTDRLWAPNGVSLWFQSWDLPSTFLAWLLWEHVPAIAIYNVMVLLTFPLSALSCYALCRYLWRDQLAAALGGMLYSFSTFHYGSASANLHIASMEWAPLYVLGLLRTIRERDRWSPLLVGTALALASMASVYHGLFCAVATAVIAPAELSKRPRREWAGVLARTAAGLCVFLVLCGWLVVGMLRSYLAEPYLGAHPAANFSLDLQSLFVPNAVNLFSRQFTAWRYWGSGE